MKLEDARSTPHRIRRWSFTSRCAGLSTPAIGRDPLIRNPHAIRQSAGLPEHVDRDTAARIPVAADAQPFRLDLGRYPLADRDRAVLVECAVIAEARDIEFQGFRFQQP